MFILNIRFSDKTKVDTKFDTRFNAQHEVNILFLKKRIDLTEWRRLTDILSEPGIEGE